MGAENITRTTEDDSPQVTKVEISGLRQELFPWMLIITGTSAWLWLSRVVQVGYPIGLNQVPVVALLLATWFAYLLRERWYEGACWILCVGAICSVTAIVAAHPASRAMCFGVLPILIASASLGTWPALLVGVLMWLSGAFLPSIGIPLATSALRNADMAIFYLMVWGMGWLAMRPLSTAVAQSLSGWQQASQALAEARQRRAELYRTLRAMEEATYRIDHMNHELIVARREAEAARALKARFVATVSHELRGPLNLILGFSRFMALSPELYECPLPVAYRADMDAIFRNATHLSALVDDILDLSQIEAERLPLVKDRIDLEPDVIEKAVHVVRPLAERKGLVVRVECPRNLPWILADEVRLRQTLVNLLANAVRFTAQGEIVVHVMCQEQELLVSVQDTGSGIAPEDLPKLFREFGQLGQQERRKQDGSGLGLAIAKQLVELHSGQIWAESTPGVGTTIRFTLPLPGVSPSAAKLTRMDAVGRSRSWNQTCLVIHDDPTVVRVLGRYLDGYRVVGLPSEGQVGALVKELYPSAIITAPDRLPPIQAVLQQCSLDIPVVTCALPRPLFQRGSGQILGYLIKPIAPESTAAVMGQVEKENETTVLLVDDEPDAVRLLEATLMLVPRPYRIFRAYSGDEALALMQQVVPDVLFIDLVMPGLGGEETIAKMQADERLAHVPVVVVSARDAYEGQLAVEFPLTIHRQEPLDLGRATRFLSAMIEGVSRDSPPNAAPV